jgi:cytochrome c oxidase subunit 4
MSSDDTPVTAAAPHGPEASAAAAATAVAGTESPPEAPAPAGDPVAVEPAAAPHPPVAAPGEHGAHPTDIKYVLIGLVLAVLTGIEVTISYTKGLGIAGNPLLIILAALKFMLVVGYFMHLRFDNPMFRRFFVTGFILAIVVYSIVLLTLGIFSTTHGIHG